QLRVQGVDLALEPLDLGSKDAERSLRAPRALGRGEIGAEVEEIVLDPGQHGVGSGLRVAAGLEPRQADRRVGLVDRADRLDAERVFLDPRAVAERRLAAVAATGVDARELDHRPPQRRNSHMKTMNNSSAMPCSSTRDCMSLFDRRALLPRAM